MRVGIGLPNTTPGATGPLVLEWARTADEGPFSTLAVLDRLGYDSYEPLVTLAAAAACTSRIGLATMIAIAPLRNTAVFAKQAASIDALSTGRLTLGVGVGARKADYQLSGLDRLARGRTLSDQLAFIRGGLGSSGIAPLAAREWGPQLLVGGASDQAFSRMARYGDGYAHGGGPPRAFARAAARARAAWTDMERPGEPRLWGQGYFALSSTDRGAAYLRDYYAFTGPFADRIAAENLTSPRAIRDFIRGYSEEGCDELILLPTVSDIDQVKRLADVLG
jgi:alkanesulfonate monooxygenase SsuD/methylene tetrahydromethanopterin reductase-like flavin-dependent oxidoreductase (luciferase family)